MRRKCSWRKIYIPWGILNKIEHGLLNSFHIRFKIRFLRTYIPRSSDAQRYHSFVRLRHNLTYILVYLSFSCAKTGGKF